jgi:hypothetical protein
MLLCLEVKARGYTAAIYFSVTQEKREAASDWPRRRRWQFTSARNEALYAERSDLRSGLMGTDASVQRFPVIAVHAKHLEAGRIAIIAKPFENAGPTIADFLAMNAAVVLDVIKG